MDIAPYAAVTGPPTDRTLYGVRRPGSFRKGGIGVVYEAELRRDVADHPAGTRVGLKLLSGVDEQRFRKILERSERLRAARHPHLAVHVDSFVGPPLSAHRVAEEDADLFYSAHVWVEGTSLRDHEPAAPDAVLGWLGQVAAALDHLHTLPGGGFAHRDVHAGNVIVRPDGTAVLMDFDTILWGELSDTRLTSLTSPRAIDAVGLAGAQRADRSMLAVMALTALAGGEAADAAGSLGELQAAAGEGVAAGARGTALVAHLRHAVEEPPATATELVEVAADLLSGRRRPPRRPVRLPRAARSPRVVAVAGLLALVLGMSVTAWSLGRRETGTPPTSAPRSTPTAPVAPAFACWDGSRQRTLEKCGDPDGVAGLNWAFLTLDLTSASCSPQGEDYYASCSFADAGVAPVPGIPDADAPGPGGGLTFADLRSYACAYECRDWVVDGELTGRIQVERPGASNTWDTSSGATDLVRVTVAYAGYDVLLDFFVTDESAIDVLLERLHPRPASQMRGVAVTDGSATACWNGTSAASPDRCPVVGGRAGLLWAFPGLRGRLVRCEDHSGDVEEMWICDYSDLGLTDVPGAGAWPHQLYVRFTSGTPGAQQVGQAPTATRDVREWRIGEETVGTFVRTTDQLSSGSPLIHGVEAGYAAAPFWFDVAGRSQAEVDQVVELLHPRAILTDRG